MLRIGQHGVGGTGGLSGAVHCAAGCDGQRDYLCSGFLEGFVLVAQPYELRSVRPSPALLEKDQHHRPFGQLLRQRECATRGPLEDKFGGDFGDR